MPNPPAGRPGKSGHPVGLSGERFAVLALARQYGLPQSILLGRPWPGPGEALWTPDDLEVALGYEQWLGERCARCGTFEDEWLDPTTHRHIVPPKYEPELVECPGCAEIERYEAAFSNPKSGHRAGMRTRLRRVMGPDEAPFPGIYGHHHPTPAEPETPPPNPLRFRL